jgi:Catalytic LigB subunit of aromatic ring-opening dioxygenase
MQVPIVPIFIGGIVPPLPSARRCFALGQMVRDAVAAWPDALRVAILASGSVSLDIGGPLAPPGQIAGVADPAWVDEVLEYLRRAAHDDLLNAAAADRLARAGNIGGELLNWIALLGALGPRKPVMVENSWRMAMALLPGGGTELVSVYGVHKLLKRIQRDPTFRERLASDADAALSEYPLELDERAALVAGEVGVLNRMGVHGYLLNTLVRYRAFGMTPERYMERIRA